MLELRKDTPILLTDDEVGAFIARGYHLVEPEFSEGFNDTVRDRINALQGNPGNDILDAVPLLNTVYNHPAVRGALISLLGNDYTMNGHRHLHSNPPGSRSQGWHQDGTNVRHHQIWTVLAMYYPQDVPPEMGPTVVMPGTHFRNAPTDRLQSYGNLKGQAALTVKAGTVAITHYDLWHAMTLNRTDTPRHMLKFLFDRQSAPSKPSWNHDPETADGTIRKWITAMVGVQGYCSDYYKEWELRKEMWLWIKGTNAVVPPGAFKDMLA